MTDEASQPEADSIRLPRFRGQLTPSQIAIGMNAASRNARRLADDARLLLEHGRFPTAASVADLLAREKTLTTREIELWIEHMQPVYGAPLHEMKAALVRWYAAMRDEGLYTDGDRDLESFVWGA